MTKRRLGLMSEISGSWFIQPRGALFLSLMVTNGSGESSFSRFKINKTELKGRNIPGEVVHTMHSAH